MFSINKEHLKYPLYLFLVILISKICYVVIESFYNYYVLITTTSADLDEQVLNDLNTNGHIISAIGITLLILPFLYFILKIFPNKLMYKSLAISSVIVYVLSYNMLNYAVDYIVESNKEKRYEAYYVNIFKYGALNNIFKYNSFVDNQKIINNTLDVNDKILLTNTFLLLYVDDELIEKLKERGKEVVADIYIDKYQKDDFTQKYNQFKNATQKIAKIWNEFNTARKNLKTFQSKLINDDEISKAHNELIAQLRVKYRRYNKANDTYEEQITARALNNTNRNLLRYFKYKNDTRAQAKYKRTMNDMFGYYIEPTIWIDSNNQISNEHIKKVITAEFKKNTHNIEANLSAEEFLDNLDVKIEVSKELKEKGILIPYTFDYSYEDFKKVYTRTVIQKYNNAPDNFYKQLQENIGDNDLKLTFTWNNFIDSDFLNNLIHSKISIKDEAEFRIILEAIRTQDLANFRKMVYLPAVKSEVNKMMYKKEDFLDGGEAAEKGNEAIKLLYIPPFALAVSIIALLLNLFTVLSMSLKFFDNKVIPTLYIKIVFILILSILPFITNYGKLENKFLESVNNEQVKNYLVFLNWISFYEKVNSNMHK